MFSSNNANSSIVLLITIAAAVLFLSASKTSSSIKNNRKKRSCWIKDWRKTRKICGNYQHFIKELSYSNASDFKNFLRMDEVCFNRILTAIFEDIKKKDTMFRTAVPPAERLAVTLRFLATGEDFNDLNYNTKLSTAFLSNCILEVCEAIYENMKDEFLKVNKKQQVYIKIKKIIICVILKIQDNICIL